MKIAVGGSSANPPHLGHRALIEYMISKTDLFDKIIWIPCGHRTDKKIDNEISPDHRIAMTELTIDPMWRTGINQVPLLIKYDEIYGPALSTYYRLELLKEQYPEDTEFTWFTGSDSNILGIKVRNY